jgi:hypothetical protein
MINPDLEPHLITELNELPDSALDPELLRDSVRALCNDIRLLLEIHIEDICESDCVRLKVDPGVCFRHHLCPMAFP